MLSKIEDFISEIKQQESEPISNPNKKQYFDEEQNITIDSNPNFTMSPKVQYFNTPPWTKLIEVSPPQFNVKCQLQKEEFLKLSIISNCNDCIAWKIKIKRSGRYMVSTQKGIIQPNQYTDCTIVLSKLKEIPDTKKPDKFLIQATKIHSRTQFSDLPQLWKDCESKHDAKRGVYAYQSVIIQCFLHIDMHMSVDSSPMFFIKVPNAEGKKQNEIIKQNETHLIEKYDISDLMSQHCDNDNVLSCRCFQRLKSNLQQKKTRLSRDDFFFYDEIVIILDDYLHLISTHDTDEEFEKIANQLGFCNITKCELFNHNFRNRNKLKIMNEDRMLLYGIIEAEESATTIARYQIIDKIHCFYQHCFDIGNKLTTEDKMVIVDEKSDEKMDILLNTQVIKLNTLLSNKRQTLKCEELSNMINNKANQLKEQYGSLSIDSNDRYNFGFYVSYVGDPTDTASLPFMGTTIYIRAKHSSLKDEMIDNTILSLSSEQFNIEYEKCQIHFNSAHKKTNYPNISMKYLLSLMIYCNYTTLQCEFSKTYRSEHFSKHDNFYHLGLGLKLAIHECGTEINEGNVKTFYHGIGERLLFPAYVNNIYIYCPLSTTSSFCVAMNFTNSNHGLVVEFGGWEHSHSKYFSVSWLSDYGNESEYLFIQNNHSLQINNITDVRFGYKYNTVLKALKIIDSRTKYGKESETIDVSMRSFIIKIIHHQLAKVDTFTCYQVFDSLPEYATQLIDIYFKNKTTIYIGDSETFKTETILVPILISMENKVIEMNKITTLFPNIKVIYIYGIDLCVQTMDRMLSFLAVHRNTKLSSLWIRYNQNAFFKDTDSKNDEKNVLHKYQDKFKKVKFRLTLHSSDGIFIKKIESINQ